MLASQFFLAYMPFHIFLSQFLSLATGGLGLWKIGKDMLLIGVVMFTICLVTVQGKANRVFKLLLGFTVLYGVLHFAIWVLNPDVYSRSAMLGILYNMRLPLFLILGYGSVLLISKFVFSSLIKTVLIISTVVAVLGVIQYFLPPDLLTHFGYSLERGARPSFIIDTNDGLIRIMSTLREPNALGAYLLLPITGLVALLCNVRHQINRRILLGGILGIHTLALFLTFSRSAWLATAVSVAVVLVWQLRVVIGAHLKRWWLPLAGLGIVLVAGFFFLQKMTVFQQYVLHTNPAEETDDLDSNDYHLLYVQQGLEGIADKPLGHGPGTAGLASISNPSGGQLTENYYIQIGYEVGIAGLALFAAFNVWLYMRLWCRQDVFGLILCASFIGYFVVNMLLHTWSNEAVAAQWWLLAGMALFAGKTGAANGR
jgi:hypothetical protein